MSNEEIRDGPDQREEGLRPASTTTATPRQTGAEQPACLNDNGDYLSAQYFGTRCQVISSCKTRRKQHQARHHRNVEYTPPPDCSPATPGPVLADTGWFTVDHQNLRLFIVEGNNGEATRRWAERVLRTARENRDDDGREGPDDPNRPKNFSGSREPRRPINPAKCGSAQAEPERDRQQVVAV